MSFNVGAVWARIIEPALYSDAVRVFHQPVKMYINVNYSGLQDSKIWYKLYCVK